MAELQGIKGIPTEPQLRKPSTYTDYLEGLKGRIFKESVMEPGFIDSLTAPEGSPIDHQNISSVAGGRIREMFVDPMKRYADVIDRGMKGEIGRENLTIKDQLTLIEGQIDTTIGGLFQHSMSKGGFDPNTLHMFVGPKAKDIVKAEKMAMRGASPAEIQSKMLMHKKPDGMWRKEISDAEMQLNVPSISPDDFDKPVNQLNWTFPDEAIVHPEFKDKYPELWNESMMQTRIEPGLEKKGSFTSGTEGDDYSFGLSPEIKIEAPDIEQGRRVAGHELQHGVQDAEGWGRGGSPGQFMSESRSGVVDMWNDFDDKVYDAIDNAVGLKKFTPEEARKIVIENTPELLSEYNNLRYIDDLSKANAYEKYQNLLGEREARSTAERLGMSLEERRGSLPDVGEGAQVLMRDGKSNIAMSAEDYRGGHTAPTRDYGARGDSLAGNVYPDDIYSSQAARYYGHGGDQVAMDRKTATMIKSMKGNPEKEITIYRAVPKDVKGGINNGDWTTINKDYADFHGDMQFEEGYRVIEKKVKVKDIYTDGNSFHEWGYDPE